MLLKGLKGGVFLVSEVPLYSQGGMLGVRYKLVDVGAGKSLGLPSWWAWKGRDKA